MDTNKIHLVASATDRRATLVSNFATENGFSSIHTGDDQDLFSSSPCAICGTSLSGMRFVAYGLRSLAKSESYSHGFTSVDFGDICQDCFEVVN